MLLGHVSHITSYNNSGLPLSMIDPNGIVTTFTYDARQRLLTRTVQASSTFAYNGAGNVTTITLPDNCSLFYTYDTAHRVTSVKDSLNGTIAYTLDANGDITQQNISAGSTLAQIQSAAFDSLGLEFSRFWSVGEEKHARRKAGGFSFSYRSSSEAPSAEAPRAWFETIPSILHFPSSKKGHI
jgi:YD repeat-containing protein